MFNNNANQTRTNSAAAEKYLRSNGFGHSAGQFDSSHGMLALCCLAVRREMLFKQFVSNKSHE